MTNAIDSSKASSTTVRKIMGACSFSSAMFPLTTTTIACSPDSAAASHARLTSHYRCSSAPRCMRHTSNLNSRVTYALSREGQHRSSTDLTVLKGIGPVNAGLLAVRQITTIERLQEMYHTMFRKEKEELTRFLLVCRYFFLFEIIN